MVVVAVAVDIIARSLLIVVLVACSMCSKWISTSNIFRYWWSKDADFEESKRFKFLWPLSCVTWLPGTSAPRRRQMDDFLTTAWFVTLPCYPVLVAAIFRNFPIEFLPSGAFIYHTEWIGFRLWFMAKYRKDTSSGTFISVGQSWLRKALYKNIGQSALLLAGAVGQKRSFRSWQCIMGNHDNAHFKMADVLRWFFCFDGIHVLCLRLAWL